MKISNGLWSIVGMVAFFAIEKIFPDDNETLETKEVSSISKATKSKSKSLVKKPKRTPKHVSKKFLFFQSFKVGRYEKVDYFHLRHFFNSRLIDYRFIKFAGKY